MLASVGCVVEVAENGAVALEMLESRGAAGFDLVFMDMQMPVMDGLTATRAIRRLPDMAALPIVAMTANAMEGDREKCIAAGMNDHVAKPIDPDELWRKLLQWIPQARRTGGPTQSPAGEEGSDAAALQALAAIDGLDLETGLRQAMDRPGLYRSLLGKFAAGQKDFRATIHAALAAADRATARRLAHTLKGVAGQVGARRIAEAAGRIEAATSEASDKPDLAADIDALATQLEQLVAAITAALPANQPAAAQAPDAPAAPDPAKLDAVKQQLIAQLEADDYESGTTVAANAALLRPALGDAYDDLVARIGDFDFEGALRLIEPKTA